MCFMFYRKCWKSVNILGHWDTDSQPVHYQSTTVSQYARFGEFVLGHTGTRP
jgi:hypothetical protein